MTMRLIIQFELNHDVKPGNEPGQTQPWGNACLTRWFDSSLQPNAGSSGRKRGWRLIRLFSFSSVIMLRFWGSCCRMIGRDKLEFCSLSFFQIWRISAFPLLGLSHPSSLLLSVASPAPRPPFSCSLLIGLQDRFPQEQGWPAQAAPGSFHQVHLGAQKPAGRSLRAARQGGRRWGP